MGLTDDQFRNVLAFVTLMAHERVLDMSPDYIVEKFNRYIGRDAVISGKDGWRWGLDIHKVDIMDEYIAKWCEK